MRDAPAPTAPAAHGTVTAALARLALPAATLLMVGLFLLDLQIPLGFAGGMLYVLPVLLGLWIPYRRLTLAVAGVGTALTIAGYFTSEGVGTPVIVLNRGAAILSVWVVAAAVVLYRSAQQALTEKADELAEVNVSLEAENALAARLEESLRRLIAELEEKNAELERFTYTVSHDLKSPLITIKGFLGVLQTDVADGDTERVGRDVERISRAAERMEQLLDELLELSRIGRVVNPPVDIPLKDLVDETLELLAGPVQERGVSVEVADDLPVVHGDRVRLREVMQNLIENAVKFLGDQADPRIEIGARRNGETVIFVRDNGIGIDPRYADKVFGLFERLNRDGEGTGVGLTLVKRIVEVQGGRIWVESEGLGEGSCFCFTLARRPDVGATPEGENDVERQPRDRPARRGQ